MNKPTASEKVSAEINAIRTAAGWDGETCTTCCRSVHSPFRIHDERGKVTHGCVDSSHEGKLVTPSESARWHHRPEALAMRRADRDKLREMGRTTWRARSATDAGVAA